MYEPFVRLVWRHPHLLWNHQNRNLSRKAESGLVVLNTSVSFELSDLPRFLHQSLLHTLEVHSERLTGLQFTEEEKNT